MLLQPSSRARERLFNRQASPFTHFSTTYFPAITKGNCLGDAQSLPLGPNMSLIKTLRFAYTAMAREKLWEEGGGRLGIRAAGLKHIYVFITVSLSWSTYGIVSRPSQIRIDLERKGIRLLRNILEP